MTKWTNAITEGGFRLRDLRLGAFAFVMATGIVSTSILNSGANGVAEAMFIIANVTYFILIGHVLVRFFRREKPVDSGFMALTFVAASGVLGAHYAFQDNHPMTLVFVILGTGSWAILGYSVAARVFTGTENELTALDRVDGTWFLWVVSTQSVAVLSGAYAIRFGSPGLATFAALCWSVGVVQLLLIAAIVFTRLALDHVRPDEPVAPYWIFMGSAAITILAGAEILGLRTEQSLLEPLVVSTVSMVLWSFATWLIPLLIALFIWQHLRRHRSFVFQPYWWSMVFPIGMYGESSRQLGTIRGTGWLEDVGQWESWVALAAWFLACAAALGRAVVERDRTHGHGIEAT